MAKFGDLPRAKIPLTRIPCNTIEYEGAWGPDYAKAVFEHFKRHFLPEHKIGKKLNERILNIDREALIGDLSQLDFLFGDPKAAKSFEAHVQVDENGIESLVRNDPAHALATSLGSSYEKLISLEKGEAYGHIPSGMLRENSVTGVSLQSILLNFQDLRKTLIQAVNDPEIAETMLMTELDQMDLAIQSYKAKGQGAEKPTRKKG